MPTRSARARRGEEDLDNVGFFFFEDPDGNGWTVQQITARGVAAQASADRPAPRG